jgi:hypothetical protein
VTATLLLVLSCAAPCFQEATRERVKASVSTYISPRTRPEDRTRIVERLGTMGPAAVGFVQSVADTTGPGPGFPPTRYLAGEVRAELLRRLGDESGVNALSRFRGQVVTIDVKNALLETALDQLRRQGISQILLNPAEVNELSKLRFTVKTEGEPAELALDRLFSGHKLDYFARGAMIVIASRAWLWGPTTLPAADEALEARLAKALGQLDSEALDKRAAGERAVVDCGLAAIPLLEKEAAAATGAKKERLHVLIDRTYARHVPDRLHPADAEPGLLAEEAQEFLASVRNRPISISFFRPTTLSDIVARIAEFSELPVAFDPSLPAGMTDLALSLVVDGAPVQDVLEALVVPLGAAVRPEAGRLLISARR